MTAATARIARVIADSGEVYPMGPLFQESLYFAITPSADVKTLQRELALAYEGLAQERGITKELAAALRDCLAYLENDVPLPNYADAEKASARAALSKVPQ